MCRAKRKKESDIVILAQTSERCDDLVEASAVMTLAVLFVAFPSLSPFFSRSDALTLVNHPLVVQLGTADLPFGSFHRSLLAREEIMAGLNDGLCASRANVSPQLATLRELTRTAAERARASSDTWRTEATSAGKSIEVEGISCYTCGGNHFNRDCPEECTGASSSALALASYLRSATCPLAAASAVLSDLSFASDTLLRAGLDGGDAFGNCVRENAKLFAELSEACDRALEASDAEERATTEAQASTARALLYAVVDSEAGEAGLQSLEMGTNGVGLQAAREVLDAVEPGFLAAQDRNAQFLKEEVLGAQGKGARPNASPAGPAGGKAAAVDAAAAYLAAKQAAQQPVGSSAASAVRDAQAALIASKGGSKQAAAKTYLAMRSKQKAAEAYLAARKANKGAEAAGGGTSGGTAAGGKAADEDDS